MVQLSHLIRRMLPVGGTLFLCLLLVSAFASTSAFAATQPQAPHYKFKLVNPAAHLTVEETGAVGAMNPTTIIHCLNFSFWNTPNIYANYGQFHFGVYNACPSRVTGIVAAYTLTQIGCDLLGTGSRSGSLSVPSMNPGQNLSSLIGWYSYCIDCSNGQIVGFPPFMLDVDLTTIRGFIGSEIVLNSGGAQEDSAFLDNNESNPGPLHC